MYRLAVVIMRMTSEEFARIRPLQWVLRDYGGVAYNSPVDRTSTRLFWLDFIRCVFAPKYKAQRGVTSIHTAFDTSQPVMLSDGLDLKLPTMMETAAYFADNQTLPSPVFVLNRVTRVGALAVTVVLFLLMALVRQVLLSTRGSSGGVLYDLATTTLI